MTQKEMLIKYLKKHKTITTLEAVTKLYILDPQKIIQQLKNDYIINDEWIIKKNRYGKKVKFKKYRLEGDI